VSLWQEEKGSDEDSDSEAERRKVQQQKQQQVAAFTDTDNMDDEVERVLGHRCCPMGLPIARQC
jgi:hypothetical protein